MKRDRAKKDLLRWHRWSVVLRRQSYQQVDKTIISASLRSALDGSDNVPELGFVIGPWINGPDYDPQSVQAISEGFIELFKFLVQREFAGTKRLGDLFDAIEFLPLELMRVGPFSIEYYLDGYAQEFSELLPMASRFRHRHSVRG